MKILVVGSKGFIGSHVAAFYKTQHNIQLHECDVVTDYSTENYHLIDATNSHYHEIFRSNVFDICINCSGAASVPDSFLNPFRDFTLNSVNVVKLLDSIRLHQPECKLVNISSAAVYGSPSVLPVSENSLLAPISPYGMHKMHGETVCKTYYRFFGVKSCSLRIFSAYGIGLKKQLFWDIYQKATRNDTFEVYGTGLETRDFIHIEDVVQAINCCLHLTPFQGEAINIANGQEITIRTAVDTFLSFFPTPKTAIFNQKTKLGDPLYWKADNSTLMSMNYMPAVHLKSGLDQYYKWISKL